MDASVLENQIKQRLRLSANRNLSALVLNGSSDSPPVQTSDSLPPSRTGSSEPPLPRASSRQNIANEAKVGSFISSSEPRSLPVPNSTAAGDPKEELPTSRSNSRQGSRLGQIGESENIQLKKQFLPEAPPVESVPPKPLYELEKANFEVAAATVEKAIADKEDEDFSDADDEWNSKPSPIAASLLSEKLPGDNSSDDLLKRFGDVVRRLRKWFSIHNVILGSRALDDELKSGIACCRLLASIAKREDFFEAVTFTYTPALASLSEWKNLEAFINSAKSFFPEVKDFNTSPKDIFNAADVANFFTFLVLLARAAGVRLEMQTDLPAAINADVILIRHLKQSTLANALTIIEEDDKRKASPVYAWLKECKMHAFFEAFMGAGWESLERVMLMEEVDLRALGMNREGDVRLMMVRIRDLSILQQWQASLALDRAMQFQDLPSNESFDDVSTAVASKQSLGSLDLEEMKTSLNSLGTKAQASTMEDVRSAFQVASHLFSSAVCSSRPALVFNFSPKSALVGFAGNSSPTMDFPLGVDNGSDVLIGVVQQAMSRLGFKARDKSIKLFIVGWTGTRAVMEKLVELSPGGLYVCSFRATAALSLRAIGLVDGISLDVDHSGIARVIALKQGRAIPQGFVTEVVQEDAAMEASAEKREKILMGMLATSLSECGYAPGTTKRVQGGLVVTGATLPLTPGIVKRFALGRHQVGSVARWGAASQIACHPDFQHRWFTSPLPKQMDEPLFPLMSDVVRRMLAAKSIRVAEVLERQLRLKEEAFRADELNARNDSTPQFVKSLAKSPGKFSPPRMQVDMSSPPRRMATSSSSSQPSIPMPAPLPPGTMGKSVVQPNAPVRPAPPPRPPPPAKKISNGHPQQPLKAPSHSVPRVQLPQGLTSTGIDQVDVHLAELANDVTRREVVDAFKEFLCTDFAENRGAIAKLPFREVLKRVPADLKKKLKMGGIIYMDDGDDDGFHTEDSIDNDAVDML